MYLEISKLLGDSYNTQFKSDGKFHLPPFNCIVMWTSQGSEVHRRRTDALVGDVPLFTEPHLLSMYKYIYRNYPITHLQ